MSTALAEKTEAALPAMHPASDTDALLAIIERVASDPEADPERAKGDHPRTANRHQSPQSRNRVRFK